jgi:hypothetical protein
MYGVYGTRRREGRVYYQHERGDRASGPPVYVRRTEQMSLARRFVTEGNGNYGQSVYRQYACLQPPGPWHRSPSPSFRSSLTSS